MKTTDYLIDAPYAPVTIEETVEPGEGWEKYWIDIGGEG
jgi:hypothetical protein